jgi:hypothetical protein
MALPQLPRLYLPLYRNKRYGPFFGDRHDDWSPSHLFLSFVRSLLVFAAGNRAVEEDADAGGAAATRATPRRPEQLGRQRGRRGDGDGSVSFLASWWWPRSYISWPTV